MFCLKTGKFLFKIIELHYKNKKKSHTFLPLKGVCFNENMFILIKAAILIVKFRLLINYPIMIYLDLNTSENQKAVGILWKLIFNGKSFRYPPESLFYESLTSKTRQTHESRSRSGRHHFRSHR